MSDELATPDPEAAPDLATRLTDDLLKLDTELREIDMLATQARDEAARHEGRLAAAAEKLAALPEGDAMNRLEQTTALITLTKRADLMTTQVQVLDGKLRTLSRYRDAVAAYLGAIGAGPIGTPRTAPGDGVDQPNGDGDADAEARATLAATEDLRREIARAMHDGPAQSLTNIVLQAQIVERLVDRDPASAANEVRALTAMVQQTLDATKSFIFDVRPMVLDDLGLVPTLRRATRERGRRAGIPVAFDSVGRDRRLPSELESSVFRIIDEALAGYLASAPDEVVVGLQWSDHLAGQIIATRAAPPTERAVIEPPPPPANGEEMPPALAAMLEERLEAERDAAEAKARDAAIKLPAPVWREIKSRASLLGIHVERLADGAELHLSVDISAFTDAEGAAVEGVVG